MTTRRLNIKNVLIALALLAIMVFANAHRPKCSEIKGSDNADGALIAQCE